MGKNFDKQLPRKRSIQVQRNNTKFSEFSHIFQQKTTWQLLKLAAAVMGIEFAYSAETAFVSPILLELGIQHEKMTLVWALSPLLGFFLAPLLGSLSDGCRLSLGRRRPLILFLAIGLFVGLIFVPYGKDIGILLGDVIKINNATDNIFSNESFTGTVSENHTHPVDSATANLPWIAVIITIIGVVLMDFNADVCQSPVRAYLLEVSIPEDHARGLSTFTVMAGLGGFLGYALGGIDWNALKIGTWLGGNIKTVFLSVTIIFLLCIVITVSSFAEVPLPLLEDVTFEATERFKILKYTNKGYLNDKQVQNNAIAEEPAVGEEKEKTEEVKENGKEINDNAQREKKISFGNGVKFEEVKLNVDDIKEIKPEEIKTVEEIKAELKSFAQCFKTIISMPKSLKILYLTNLFTWMSHLSYTLYFTDFVGESVFGGDPSAARGSQEFELYNSGVRFGCWGMAVYSLACAVYSFIIESLMKKFRAKKVYVGGLIVYAIGMAILALVRSPIAVLILSITAGIAYSTLFTIPYLILAHYHTTGWFKSPKPESANIQPPNLRGLGTDIAIIGSTVFVAQLSLSLGLGWLVELMGSATAVIWAASALSAIAAVAATQVVYLDL